MSITELTADAAWIAGLAIVALVATGWRKTARATAAATRGRRHSRAFDRLADLDELEAPMQLRTSMLRRLWAAIAGSAIAVVVGAMLATVVSFTLAWIVIRATGMLQR